MCHKPDGRRLDGGPPPEGTRLCCGVGDCPRHLASFVCWQEGKNFSDGNIVRRILRTYGSPPCTKLGTAVPAHGAAIAEGVGANPVVEVPPTCTLG